MKHRHPGRVTYRRKGKVRTRKKPIHPKTGSWATKKYIHGPRVKQSQDFKKMYTVNQHWAKRRGLKIKAPDEDSLVKVGTLHNGSLAVQSYLTPTSKYKNKTYKELKDKFDIKARRDDDKDLIPNKDDCRPFDKDKQDIFFFKSGGPGDMSIDEFNELEEEEKEEARDKAFEEQLNELEKSDLR